jgi:hypothetical protein
LSFAVQMMSRIRLTPKPEIHGNTGIVVLISFVSRDATTWAAAK